MNNMDNNRRSLSKKEEVIMNYFWQCGPMYVRELIEKIQDLKENGPEDDSMPHPNTVYTFVRTLEAKGWLTRERVGNTYQYAPAVEVNDYRDKSIRGFIDRFFGKSYLSFVSSLVKEEKISTDELRELIEQIENGRED